jgi:large subunit ribosomal protein L10
MKKQDKQAFVNELAKSLELAQSIILVDYAGLSVKAQQELKKRLKQAGAQMLVIKNTLLARAGKKAKISTQATSQELLSGPTALILANEDPVSPIQVLGKFVQEFDLPQLKAGIIEGIFQDKSALIKISQLPSKETLLGQVVSGVVTPLYGLVGSLEANLQKLISVLENAQKGGEGNG